MSLVIDISSQMTFTTKTPTELAVLLRLVTVGGKLIIRAVFLTEGFVAIQCATTFRFSHPAHEGSWDRFCAR